MEKRIKRIISSAYTKTPFYMQRKEASLVMECVNNGDIGGLLQKIPILEKNEAVAKNSSLLSAEYLTSYMNNELHVECTSGSTGKFMEVYWNKADYQRSLLPLYSRRREQYGIVPWDRFCYFFTARKLGIEDVFSEESLGKLGFCKSNLNEERIIQMYNKILEYQPVWILGQPSMLLLLADVKRRYKLDDINSLRYIELTGEILFDTIRAQIFDAFHCSVANHYGAMEVNTIAYECPYGKLHLTESTLTTVINDKGKKIYDEEGDICITSLENCAMPIINYRVGDRGILYSSNKCDCGLETEVLELTTGRINDFIITRGGEKVNSYVFVRTVELINVVYSQLVKQFSVIQRDYDDFLVYLVLDDDFDHDIVEKMFVQGIWQAELSDARYEFVFSEELYPNETGKMKYFRNEMRGRK